MNAAQTLPTSSSGVEQTFSGVKLIKTLLRNRLSADKVEAILLILQSYGGKKKIEISDKLVSLLKEVKGKFYQKKKSKVRASPTSQETLKRIKSNEEEEEKKNSQDDIAIVLNSSQNDSECDDIEEEAIWDNIPSYGEKIEFLTETNPKDQEMEIESPKT